jgi:hypothetical protein
MPKFYVTAGQIREIITAADAEGAALEAIDRFFEPLNWVFAAEELTESDRRAYFAVEALTCLDARIRVSEVGFGANLADLFNTADMVDMHFRLTTALSRWERSTADLTDVPSLLEFQQDEYLCPVSY